MWNAFKKSYKPAGPVEEIRPGLLAAVDLGLLYLDERQLGEADKFFRDLCPDNEPRCAGRLLSQLGHAMVLAFNDKPAESNNRFSAIAKEIDKLETAAKGGGAGMPADVEVYKLLWKTTPPAAACEMVARALNHNYLNDSTIFPKTLEPWRNPPRPALKAPAPA